MKDEFLHRWKLAVAAARSAAVEPEPTVPFGFAARVLALSREQAAGLALASLWQLFDYRTLGGLVLASAIIAAVELSRGVPAASLQPMVEQSVEEQIFWLPS